MKSNSKKHADIEYFSLCGSKMRYSTASFIFYAKHYLESAKTAPRGENNWNPARYFLVCKAIELSFKAFLSLEGISMVELSQPRYSHNLDSLMKEAKQRGIDKLVNINNTEEKNIEKASVYYKEKVYEYPAIMEMICAYDKNPNWEKLVETCESLIQDLYNPCMDSI